MRKEPTVLVVLDGWGIGKEDASNPISAAKPKNINYIKRTYPYGALQASGIAVGLPWGENGDSEVGHMTLGAGKVLYQDYPRISLKIKDGSFFKNDELLGALKNAKDKNSRVHLIGLIGRSNIHSSIEHLNALIELTRKENIEKIMHIFTDGRDSPAKSASDIVSDLPGVQIASISGRFFAMDKDLHWERTKRTYDALVGNDEYVRDVGVVRNVGNEENVGDVRNKENVGNVGDVGNEHFQQAKRSNGSNISNSPNNSDNSNNSNISDFFRNVYANGSTDEFIEPVLINPEQNIKDSDSVIFFNYQGEGMRQLAEMFSNPDTGGKHTIPQNLHIVTFTKYSDKLNFRVAFPADKVLIPLGKVLSDNGLVQLRIAETEKYAHVTYFFNGLVEPPFKNEYRVLIPSKNIARHDQSPEMMASEITTRAVSAISEGVYDFILINYANADMIGHTGNFDAAISAIRHLDEQIGTLTRAILDENGTLIITADHGNVENMLDRRTGLPETTHNPSPVPIYIIRNGYEREKSDEYVSQQEDTNVGVLSDVAPTILELMGIQKPEEMTGISLLRNLR